MSAWILSLMLLLQPAKSTPWAATYEATAQAIASASVQSPLFAGAHGAERTAALLTALAWFESRFDVHASGDHNRSHGLFQQQGRGELGTAEEATKVAIEQIRVSFAACKGRPFEDSLANYASGRGTCTNAGGLVASRHRVGLALRLFREHPAPVDGAI